MSDQDRSTSGASPAGDQGLARGVANVVDAALGVGVSVARIFAQASAGDRRVAEPGAGSPPIAVIVHYGLATLGNVASVLTDAVGAVRGAAKPAAADSSGATATRGGGPRVAQGATLRVPLSVENQSDAVMRGLAPRVRAVRRAGRDASETFAAEVVRFSPGLFDVAPRDFEKLTVFVDVPVDAAEGEYELVLALGPNEPDLPMVFGVVAATPASPL